MDSMRRSEANISHHHNKVVINSQATDSNKQLNISGSNLNNNNVSNKQQHQSASSNQNQQTSDIKESNFEYDDNEWDVGIGDLIIDLDADIEKSSLVNTAISSIASNSSSSSSATFSTTGSAGINTTGNKKPLYQDQQSSSSSGKLSSSNIPKISVAKHKIGDERKSGNNISKHSVLISQLNSQLTITSKNPSISSSSASSSLSSSPDLSKSRESLVPSLSSADIEIKAKNLNAMSSTTNSSGGKSATKLAVDHQATLDKGLKMKIKRTKPGTKTSEAKHEIVKAEQNGTSSSNTDDSGCNNTTTNSSSSSSNKKHTSQSLQQQPITASPLVSVSANAQQGTKRGSSGHRKDKTKEKTPHHTQRDKIEHNSTIQNADRGCICTHDMQVNGVQQPCSNISCIRNRTTEQTSPLSQRLQSSNQNNSSTGSALTSSNTANAPGPPNSTSKDSKKSNVPVPILIHSSSQISSSLNSAQLSSIQSNSTNNSSSSNNSNNNSSNSSSNNVLKSQLQGSSVPTSLLSVLSSAAANASSSSSTNTSSSSSSSSSNSSSSNLSMSDDKTNPPPAKRHKCDPKDMVDVCVGTSVGTITEPDCLGPCEPGTSVTLEGIVWHETEGGVLVVNVTWRGKTYVGTLIDCTKHDWAPPRFCDSPTEELDSRTPKGRGKRGRSAALTPNNDLSNFTETRSSVHSKLRNGGAKGRTGRTTTTTETPSKTTNTATTTTAGNNTNTPSTSPIAFLPPRSEKRKSKDESPPPVNGSSTSSSSSSNGGNNQANASGIINNGASGTQSLLNPVTGLNVQISTKKIKSTASPCAISPVLLECPEQDCGKKYKHANGLKYHQSHAHPSSMDEDSSQAPESPTTPSPTPTSQPANPPLTPTSGTQTGTTPSQPTTPTPSLAPVGPTNPVLPGTLNNQPILTTTTTPASSQPCITSSSSTVNPSSGIGLLTTATTTTTTHQLPPHPQGPAPSGGSITTGVAGQPQNLISSSTASVILGTAPSTNNQEPLSPMAQQQNINNGITTTPVRTDGSVKVKSSVLRFGPVSNDGDMGRMPPQNVTGPPPSLTLGGQGPMRNPSMPGTPESVPNFAGLANAQAPQGLKSQNFTKQKKNRKSPGPDFDNSSSSRAEDVQSPAYSDISDDSTPVIEASDVGAPKGMPQPPIGSNNLEYNKNKEPPLDLMNKPAPQTVPDGSGPMSKENSGPSPLPAPNKLMSHYYPPYNYMSGYPYNLDPNYGVPMMSEDNKMAQQAQIKEEQRMKESPSPNDYGKMGPQQMVPTKLIKSEPISAKDIKTEPGHPMHSNKEQQPQPGPQSLGPSLYPGMYRHGSSQPQQPPPQHLSREEELRRYFTYPEQRRSSTSSNSSSTNMTSKDEPQSPSQGQQQQSVNNPQSNQPQQHQQKGQKPSSVTKLKDSMKSEDKEVVKVKQEGQKPTMETQGPPPPPTSQYYLHPPYMNPTPFGFDPNPMYRNMLVPTPSYNASPYHLQMARYPSPEDLSRNPNTKALDLLQHHASQYYNSHKIHELSERALKSPTSNVKVSVSSPNMPPQNSGQNPNIGMPPSNPGGPGLPGSGPQQPSQPPQMQQSSGPGGPNNPDRNENSSSSGPKDGPPQGPGGGPQSQGQSGRSPPPQRHVHTHHHTHVGLGYPMFQPPYGAAVLASQQAAAVTVISPFPTGPPAK